MTIDYTIFYKESFDNETRLAAASRWDLFISAYNTTERVRRVFDAVNAADKRWIVHSEYGFEPGDIPDSQAYSTQSGLREDDFVHGFLATLPGLAGASLCVDLSGFMRPHLMFLLRVLGMRGVTVLDALYSEPAQYARQEHTEFAQGDVTDVRPVAGFEGLHQPSLGHDEDLLIIGAGYEHQLIRHAANAKNDTRKVQLLGFPPLQADFYQESVVNADHAAEAVTAVNETHPLFAPAYDPFVTAGVLHDTVEKQRRRGVKNVYLCPLSTRPQALGFALYWLYEAEGQAVSVIYPFAPRYCRDAATGLARIWKYRVELP